MNIEPQNAEFGMSSGNIFGWHFNILRSVFDVLRFKMAMVKPIRLNIYRAGIWRQIRPFWSVPG